MKKAKVSQATLFQSWGRGQPAQCSSSRNPTLNRMEINPPGPQNSIYNATDPDDIVDLGDEDDDGELLAAAEGIASSSNDLNFQTHTAGGVQANSSTNISCNPEEIEVIPGFDLETGNVWIYPTNYPIRNYQYDIVKEALFKNTLVTLPTGLGKTFIAAVVMYNFYRWYPQGKVIFMAPTKPLVAQQIEACFNIMGIPQSDTAEMTGNMAPNKRQSLWQSRRVFFLTPQVLQNDLNRGSCKAEEVVLLVADEAHKALGNHAYCQVVREISGYTRNFRVLALSATPGDDLEAVQQVIGNLLISHMELRSEESPDIQPYTHSRLVEKVVVPLGEDIAKIKAAYLRVLEGVVGRLFCQRALWQRDPQRVTKFLLLSARDQFRKRMNEQGGLDRNQQSRIEGDFAMCISLYHAYELLLQHGILSFYNFIKGIMDGTKGLARAKTEITKNYEFSQLMEELREEIEPPMENSANESLLFSQFSPRRRALMNIPKPSSTFKSHPKLLKLKEIVLEHFEKFQDKNGADAKGMATRVMIFSQYRDSVNEIAAMLAKHKPLVRVMSFIGQQSTGKSSRGLTQKEQLQVVQRFRQGGHNTLVATCVGEEGLDIGEVDLIVCFDAHASPIRLVQRMGRTGRKRDGRIVILVTEGKEDQVYQRSQRSKKSIHKAVMQAAKSFDLYMENPRMVPRQLTPSVLKMEMTVGKFQAQSKGRKKGRPSDGANIKNLTSKSTATSLKKSDGFLTYEELVYWQEHFKLPDHEAGLSPQLSVTKRSRRSLSKGKKQVTQPSLTEWLPWQTTLQPVKAVTHSRCTEHLVELLEFTELHSARDNDDESYDLEMMSFLNEDDVLRPGEKGDDFAEDPGREKNAPCEEGEGVSKITKKAKTNRKKLNMREEGAGAKDDGQNSKKDSGYGGVMAKKSKRGAKKRSPENKARWKEFLKQFDDKDEDFESDGVNTAAGSKENIGAECDLENEDDAVVEIDLPDVEDAYETDVNVKEANIDRTRRMQEVQQGCNKAGDDGEETERVLKSENSDLSDAASDELSNLFPCISTTPDFRGFNPGFNLQRARSASTMVSIPTPPSLDSLDKICLSPAGVEHDEVNMETEEQFRGASRKNLPEKEDKLFPSKEVPPKASFASDSSLEPFLMADFLEEDDDANTEIKTNEGIPSERSSLVKKDRQTSTPKIQSAESCLSYPTETHVNEDTQEKIRNQGSHIFGKQNFTNNVDGFKTNNCGAQSSREFRKDDKKRGMLKDANSKMENSEVVGLSDFGLGVLCGSPVNEFNERDVEGGLPQEDAGFAEAFFMDLTGDEVFTNMTLPEGDNGVKDDRCKPDDQQNLFSEGDGRRSLSCEVNASGGRVGTKLQGSKTACESKASKANSGREMTKSSNGIDLRASIDKLSAFQHNHKDRATSSTIDNNLTKHPESESRQNAVSKEIRRCFRENAAPVEAAQILPAQEIRTRGEHSNATALLGNTDMPHGVRNPAAIPPLSRTISPRRRKLSVKARQLPGCSRDGLTPRVVNREVADGNEEELSLTGMRKIAKVTSENNNAGDSVGANAGNNIGNNGRKSVGNNSSISAAGNIGSSIGNNNNNVGDSNVHNVCRSPVPKKLKLSRKRISETNPQGTCVVSNQAKIVTCSSNSLKLNSKEGSFCGEHFDGTKVNSLSMDVECTVSDTSVKLPVSMDTASITASVDHEERSENLSNLRTRNGAVVAVMESEDEEDDEHVIRPARKAISFRKRALSSPCSQEEFKRPTNPGKLRDNQPHCLSSRNLQLGSGSDDEFEVQKSEVRSRSKSEKAPQMKATSTQKRNSLEIGAKQGTRNSLDSLRKKNNNNNNRPRENNFLDDEAELSGSDINDFSSDEAEDEDQGEIDSFIDDSTQLTQRTPSTTKPRHASSPVDMMAVYRQSLRSPLCGALNFKTPVFHKQRNRYKMVYKYRDVDEGSESASEAEETYESESVLENEVGENDENEAGKHYESEAYTCDEIEISFGPGNENAQAKSHSHAERSFEESQIGRPVERMKRKRILDDTLDEEVSPKLSKQRNLSETSNKENAIDIIAAESALNRGTQTHALQHKKTGAFGNFPTKSTTVIGNFRSDFVKSSDVLAEKIHFNDKSFSRKSAGDREDMRKSGSFIEWNNDISDSELLVAFEPECAVKPPSVKKPPPSNIFQDQDLKEIAVAMEMTDDDVSIEINELPTFSLGFDFLSEEIFTNNGNAGEENYSKHNSATFTERKNENSAVKSNFANVQDSFSSKRNEFPSERTSSAKSSDSHARPEHFTKIAQCSKQLSEESCHLVKNSQSQNKAGEAVSYSVSYSRTAAPQIAAKPNISTVSSIASNQRLVSNNPLSLSTQTKTPAQSDDRRSFPSAHAKLQVVTPSCRPSSLVTRPTISPLLSSSQKDKGKTVILVDTREISSSQVVSLLRLKHNIKAEVCQLTTCDFIVSNRMAVKRKSASDVANRAKSPRLIECMRRMCDLYERPCLIIEKDRVKPGETDKKFIKTKAYIYNLASISQTHVKMLLSDSQEETASLLKELASIETKKGRAITAPTALSKEREQVFRVFVSIPRVSYITALNLCSSFNTLQEVINSTPSELERRTPGLSSPRAAEIHRYLRHKFNPEMVVTKK